MFTGIITILTLYFGIGLIISFIVDSTGETKRAIKILFKESALWPKDIYNTYKKG